MPPRNAVQSNRGRLYAYPPHEPREWYPSVTTILGIIEKPAIGFWMVNCGATEARRLHESGALAALSPTQLEDLVKRAWRGQRDGAGDVGTQVHEWLEARVKGTPQSPLSDTAQEIAARLEGLIDRYEIEIERSEQSVYHRTWQYAGTFDLIATLRTPKGRRRLLLDLKTSAGVYEVMCLQLAALRFAEIVVHDDGLEEPMPEVDGCAVLHVPRPKPGKAPEQARVVPVQADQSAFEAFCAARGLYAALRESQTKWVRAPLPEPATTGSES